MGSRITRDELPALPMDPNLETEASGRSIPPPSHLLICPSKRRKRKRSLLVSGNGAGDSRSILEGLQALLNMERRGHFPRATAQ